MNLTKKQAKRLILLHLNLLGAKTLKNKDDIIDYVKKVGCLQFDPLNIISMNPHLVLQSRVKSYKADMLSELLYKDHRLMDGIKTWLFSQLKIDLTLDDTMTQH